MSDQDELHGAAAPAEPGDNPTDEQLDVEGPNESAPGREPSEDEAQDAGDRPPPASER
jgi:hypothetical protein